MKRLTLIFLIMITALFLAGATGNPGGRFTATLTGADVRPPVDTETDGRFSISFNKEDTEGRVYLRVNDGIGITEAHLHCHDPRLNDPIALILLGPISGGEDIDNALEPFFLGDEQIAAQNSECKITNLRELREAIVKGEVYAKVHSVANPAGEIQGQVSFYRQDIDGDGLIDRRDPDIDGDGILNADDDTPYTRNLPRGGVGGGGSSLPQRAAGTPLLEESYADIPWHQKLSTKDSNLIDIPIVMPYEAIPFNTIGDEACKKVTDPIKQARCMLRYGIVNVMGMHRTDTPYQAGKAPTTCPDTNENCVEVALKVQRFHTATTNSNGYEADVIKNNPGTAINVNAPPDKQTVTIPSLGYAITEATMFAPWLPWYTGHYCAQEFDNVHDAVCYEDYFTTMIQATGNPDEPWLTEVPDVFVPPGETGIFTKFCKAGQTSCDLLLGKVKWLKNETKTAWATDPEVITTFHACGGLHPNTPDNNPDRTKEQCQQEVEDRTQNLVKQFNASITDKDYFFDDKHHYPWNETAKTKTELQTAIQTNPFIGAYNLTWFTADEQGDGTPPEHPYWSFFNGKHYVLPKRCFRANYYHARQGNTNQINILKDCALDFEIHTNGFFDQWAPLFGTGALTQENIQDIFDADGGFAANQYGRTMFLFAGVPEQHVAVSFKKQGDMSIHDKVYGSSIYTQYLPLVNPADLSLRTKGYTDQYWHSMLMSNHMNQTVDHFIRGIRGRSLWHNEYRSHLMYLTRTTKTLLGNKVWESLGHVDFPAGFQTAKKDKAPFHGNTCDSCHIRNGSGIPLMPNRSLPLIHQERGMGLGYNIRLDETYSNTSSPPETGQAEIPAMKMVLFDLGEKEGDQCDVNDHTIGTFEPNYYTNKIMNFYGNSLHVNQKNPDNIGRLTLPRYDLTYEEFENGDGKGYEIVDPTTRKDRSDETKPNETYKTWYVEIAGYNYGTCDKDLAFNPPPNGDVNWPTECSEVIGGSVEDALNGRPQQPSDTTNVVGHMHLLGHRLGNSPLIEMIPDSTIMATETAQKTSLKFPGCYGLAAGTRSGDNPNDFHYQTCSSGQRGHGENDCYISRFGWIGDRASLEDQIANAASVEMNITSKESYKSINPNPQNARELVRYEDRLCGPADKICTGVKGENLKTSNSDISEQEIRDMATYQRWIGIPNRAEYQVSSEIVQKGEQVFKDLQCQSCHVIDKIVFVNDDNMLPDEERTRLSKLQQGQPDYPFISYLGTDLLLHDMGYLSQVAKAPEGVTIRKSEDGTVKEEYKPWIQKIRTPALKGLRFNRFVTDSIHNTKAPHFLKTTPPNKATVACDFLLHDGRACDAIEAAYLHDGPAINELGMIKKLNDLTLEKLNQLRAFLYSL